MIRLTMGDNSVRYVRPDEVRQVTTDFAYGRKRTRVLLAETGGPRWMTVLTPRDKLLRLLGEGESE